jgi:hypothetical protein
MSETDLDRALERLAQAAPALAEELARTRAYWDPDPVPPTIGAGALGRVAVEAVAGLGDAELAAIAAVIEDVLGHGSEEAKDAIATGLLEAAMHATDEQPAGARFLSALGPHAKAYCRAWDEHTGARTPGVHDD